MATPIEIARLAAAGNVLRPDWPTASLQTCLTRHTHRPYHDLAVALVYVATDPASKTPARLNENGPWWRITATGQETHLPPPVRDVLDGPRRTTPPTPAWSAARAGFPPRQETP